MLGVALQPHNQYISVTKPTNSEKSFPNHLLSFTHDQAMLNANIPSLYDRQKALFVWLFRQMLDPNHKLLLNSLFPACRNKDYNLRHSRSFKVPGCKTDRFRL